VITATRLVALQLQLQVATANQRFFSRLHACQSTIDLFASLQRCEYKKNVPFALSCVSVMEVKKANQ
jgi:hypothetical protein